MKLIVLVGKKRSGKDTTADYLMKKYSCTKHQLAGPIKHALPNAWDIVGLNDLCQLDYDFWEGIGYDRETELPITNHHVIELMIESINFCSSDLRMSTPYINAHGRLSESGEDLIAKTINKNVKPWSVRRLMQTLGTDLVCDRFDRMYWLKLFAIKYMDASQFNYDYFVVPDCRQTYEFEMLRSMGATVVHVVRPEQEDSNKDTHITERGIPPLPTDTIIHNDSTLSELYSKIDKVL